MGDRWAFRSAASATLLTAFLCGCSVATYEMSDGSTGRILAFADGRALPDLKGKASIVRVQTFGLSRSVFGYDFGITRAEYALFDKSCGIVVSRREGAERTAFFDETGCGE